MNYIPAPNMPQGMNGCGATMMGAPQVVGAGQDCNNYLDSRDEHHVNDQGTVRIDHDFDRGDTLSARYSLSGENGFMPINLPGFGTFHDDFSQNGELSWNRILSPRMVNVASMSCRGNSKESATETYRGGRAIGPARVKL
jgi:hypothetical protein